MVECCEPPAWPVSHIVQVIKPTDSEEVTVSWYKNGALNSQSVQGSECYPGEVVQSKAHEIKMVRNIFHVELQAERPCENPVDWSKRDDLLERIMESMFIGVGGTFLVNGSKVKQHIMADFTTTPLDTEEKVNNWLRFYSMNPPLVALGTFVTNDPGLNLRVIHFHALSDHGEAGHYHYDTEPEKVEYLAYFNLGTKVVRMDRPQDESKLGHN
ncbi:hypothetical protein J6590_077970 [Homalodisca vitripennis]|nr:hypothetical protein J6590_077970 [Homalodisca vitripennis]